MPDSRRQAYLDAMGITAWVLRDRGPAAPAAVAPPTLKLGPGDGGTLLVCASGAEAAGSLASDVGRALGGVPVWAWPDAGDGLPTLHEAVRERLFTSVAIFGGGLAAALFPEGVPDNVQAATLSQLPSMPELLRDGGARRGLWLELCRLGIAGTV